MSSKNSCLLNIPYPAKIQFKNEDKINIWPEKQNQITSHQDVCMKSNATRMLAVEGNT